MSLRSLWRRWRRTRLLRKPVPAGWAEVFAGLPFTRELTEGERARLLGLTRVLVHEAHWEGCGGLALTDAMRVTIAAQACRLILALDAQAYSRVRSILVYPSTYAGREQRVGPGGVQSEGDVRRLGEAWLRGPVVLSWDAARSGVARPADGRNTVYHEFAHKLDMLDGFADGTPPLAGRDAYEAWIRVVGREYETLKHDAERGRKTFLDDYGATNPAEFFAVATEAFFEQPRELQRHHAELYVCMRDFYRQDPAR